jgi:hypothetical protein
MAADGSAAADYSSGYGHRLSSVHDGASARLGVCAAPYLARLFRPGALARWPSIDWLLTLNNRPRMGRLYMRWAAPESAAYERSPISAAGMVGPEAVALVGHFGPDPVLAAEGVRLLRRQRLRVVLSDLRPSAEAWLELVR